MDARLKTPEDPRPPTREEYIVETVLGIIGGATVIEDGIERTLPDCVGLGLAVRLPVGCEMMKHAVQPEYQTNVLGQASLGLVGPA